MTVKIHFETLAVGMKAKLDPSYRTNNNSVPNLRKSHGNYPGSLGDSVGKYRPPLVKRNKTKGGF